MCEEVGGCVRRWVAVWMAGWVGGYFFVSRDGWPGGCVGRCMYV